MMGKEKKVKTSIYLPSELHDSIVDTSTKTGIAVSTLIRMALFCYDFDKLGAKEEGTAHEAL